LFASSLIFVLPSLGYSDVVKLKNGETLEGVVVSKDNNYITIEMPCGEVGFDMSLVDSVDTEKGPRTKEDLATLRDASRQRAADQDAQREMATARREAAVAAEAAARRESGQEPAVEDTRPTLTAEEGMALRIEAFEEALQLIERRREREKLRRELVNYYFGPTYDPIIRVALE
jgi:hypothetical protein